MRQYTHHHLRNESGLARKKKTRKTLKAIARDHQGSDCMNLYMSVMKTILRDKDNLHMKHKALRLTKR